MGVDIGTSRNQLVGDSGVVAGKHERRLLAATFARTNVGTRSNEKRAQLVLLGLGCSNKSRASLVVLNVEVGFGVD